MALKLELRPFPLTFALPANIVFEARHARVSRFSKPAPPARAKRLQWKIAFRRTTKLLQLATKSDFNAC
jgi:hypothetical protein